MPKKTRLTGSEIRRLKPEKRLNSSLFSLSYSASDGVGKAACVVSKKVSAKATIRNTVKRRMRAALRDIPSLPGGVSLVLAAKRSTADVAYAELRADLIELIGRVRSGK
ncbi:MAG: ribonuclease P protein component [Candidatus Pacebacteria bacterium]|nr:ribonuclease P protein component [Candidatus Paceibacterota bacterium]